MITHSTNKVNDFLGEILLFLKFFIEFLGSRGAQSAKPIVSSVRFIDRKNQNGGGRYALNDKSTAGRVDFGTNWEQDWAKRKHSGVFNKLRRALELKRRDRRPRRSAEIYGKKKHNPSVPIF